MATAPLTLLPRNPDPERLPELLERCGALLADRRQADEILLLLPQEPSRRPAGCWGGKTVRVVVRPDAANAAGWGWALRAARWPVLLLTDRAASLGRADRDLLLADLAQADCVLGQRRGRRRFDRGFGLAGVLLKEAFGVQAADPFTPHLALRRRAIAGVHLEGPPELLPFEQLAKLAFASALCSWPKLALAAPAGEPSTGRRLCRQLPALWRLWKSPRLWRHGPYDPPREELSAAEPTDAWAPPPALRHRSFVRPPLPYRPRTLRG